MVIVHLWQNVILWQLLHFSFWKNNVSYSSKYTQDRKVSGHGEHESRMGVWGSRTEPAMGQRQSPLNLKSF